MTTFDSEVVAALVERARTPLDSGSVNVEVCRVLSEVELTRSDRGQLLLAQLVMLQGSLSAAAAKVQVAEAIELLRDGSDLDGLLSALAISAAVSASAGDRAACLASCLDISGILRGTPETTMSARSAANFGASLIVLGAYDLAAPLFVNAIQECRKANDLVGVVVSCTNLAMTVSRQVLVTGKPVVAGTANAERLAIVDRALRNAQTMDLGQEMRAFARAVMAHIAQLRGDHATANSYWGDLDALTVHSSDSFTQYLCLIEAPLAIDRREFDRARLLIDQALEHLATPHIVPLGRVDALQLRSKLHEHTGDLDAALADAREATQLTLNETSGFADLLIGQIDTRAALEHTQQALMERATDLREQALVDEVSQVGNRRAYEVQVEALRTGTEDDVAVLLCDIDFFKAVNDRSGHTVGDGVIRRAAAITTAMCGTKGDVFRYGGDEFVLLCRSLSYQEAADLAEAVRSAFETERWTVDGSDLAITCSIGVWIGGSAGIKEGVSEADRLLYEAKEAGRNRVRVVVPLLHGARDQ